MSWEDDFSELPSNYNVTKRRTINVINRLKKEPELPQTYGEITKDQEKSGFIEKVDVSKETNKRMHYIPHHGVRKDSSTTPIRIVYDCSCIESHDKPSLNDCLKILPPQINHITRIIARFRLHKYAVTTDIEKAFLQTQLHENDRDATRFFWSDDPTNQNITVLGQFYSGQHVLHSYLMQH